MCFWTQCAVIWEGSKKRRWQDSPLICLFTKHPLCSSQKLHSWRFSLRFSKLLSLFLFSHSVPSSFLCTGASLQAVWAKLWPFSMLFARMGGTYWKHTFLDGLAHSYFYTLHCTCSIEMRESFMHFIGCIALMPELGTLSTGRGSTGIIAWYRKGMTLTAH